MNQRRVNVAVFGFLGVIMGLLLAAFNDYDTVWSMSMAMVVGGGLGSVVGANWTPSQRRPRATSR